jgi:hypothetical protein
MMAESNLLIEKIDDLARRVTTLERRYGSTTTSYTGGTSTARAALCSVPQIPDRQFDTEVSLERARLIRLIAKKWVNGTTLHYCFFLGPPWGADSAQLEVVRRAFAAWKNLGIGLEFKEVASLDEAEIRIGFLQGDGAWSYTGREVLEIGQSERTMNLGWDLTEPGEIDTAIHEIGHSLGFPHEHQNPNAGIVWNEEAVYAALAEPPNSWSRETTFWNIIRKIPPDSVEGSTWDPNSVMHYPFGPGLIREPAQYRGGLQPAPGLSQKDIQQVRFFYPAISNVSPELKPLESQRLSIGAGEQKNFSVLPQATRSYDFRTFGESDTVMVIFEEQNGELRYLKGADDSGSDLNASFRVRLLRGRRYVLRIRLYYTFAGGDTAVVMS